MKKESGKYLDYIRDLAYLLRVEATNAHTIAMKNECDFESGREFGIRQALAWMQHEADAFDIPKDIIFLEGFDAMLDELSPPS